MFTDKDLAQIKDLGIPVETVEKQLSNFVNGLPPTQLVKPGLINDGINKLSAEEVKKYDELYQAVAPSMNIQKFIPASGAASRMFKLLFEFLHSGEKTATQGAALDFVNNIAKFAFAEDLSKAVAVGGDDLPTLLAQKDHHTIIDYFLTDKGLDYGALPKGVLKFHRYDLGNRTALEEHMVEGAIYCKQKDGTVNLHLTVSPEHMDLFKSLVEEVKGEYEQKFAVKYKISYSVQKKSTDTMAVDMDNKPFRLEDGSILFRPAGHGALLENLNSLEGELIFIKNIDNLVPDRLRDETYLYKNVLGGVFIEIKDRIFGYLNEMDKGELSEDKIQEIKTFVEEDLCTIPGDQQKNLQGADLVAYLREKLNRPIRICGMVKSDGDTGGGPFWAVNADGTVSLQIVETAQIDLNNPDQKEIFGKASHFNPNDLALGIKDYKGKVFDLIKHRDLNAGFVTNKSQNGQDLKAQELPGLWNGSMADWNTIFIDVPPITFSPVKMVNDLLEDVHQ